MYSSFLSIDMENPYWKRNYLLMLIYEKKKTLNSDGQRLHRYQQIEQLPVILNHWTQNNMLRHDVVNPGHDLEQTPTCGGVKLVNGM